MRRNPQLCTALNAASVSCTTYTVAGTQHAGSLLTISGMYTRILTWLQAHD